MTISSRFALATHILSLISLNAEASNVRLSSEKMAQSTGVNPVIVRGISGMLRRAGLVQSRQGVIGLSLTRPADQITLLDIYRAVQSPEQLFSLHEHPNAACMVGRNIQPTLIEVCSRAQHALEAELASTSLACVNREVQTRALACTQGDIEPTPTPGIKDV